MEQILIYKKNSDSYIMRNLIKDTIIELNAEYFDKTINNIDFDEKKSIKEKLSSSVHYVNLLKSSCTLSLMIVNTTFCNLNCSYCFERELVRHTKFNTGESVLKTIMFVKDALNSGNYSALDITFTGGEPLTNFDYIKNLVIKLYALFSGQLQLRFSIITNATLINNSVANFFNKYNFSIQITLDGKKEDHDKERKNYVGKGSYDLIIANINNLIKSFSNVSIKIRVNISKKNENGIKELLVDLLSKIIDIKAFEIYFAPVIVPKNDPCFIPKKLKYSVISKCYIFANHLGFKVRYGQSLGLCMFKSNNSVTLNSDGSLYKCYSLIGNKKYEISIKNNNSINSYMRGCGSLCENLNCPVHEICFGGCPYNEYVLNGTMSRDCEYDYLIQINKLLYLLELKDLRVITESVREDLISNVSLKSINV
jgi:uncharacterized protein